MKVKCNNSKCDCSFYCKHREDHDQEDICSHPGMGKCNGAICVPVEKFNPGGILNDRNREFGTGATRSANVNKLDFEGFNNPLVEVRYAEYLHKHRLQEDGVVRDSDNWQLGMPKKEYIKSLLRHVVDLWCIHRGYYVYKEKVEGGEKTHVVLNPDIFNEHPTWKTLDIQDALCAIIFNAKGYLYQLLTGGE